MGLLDVKQVPVAANMQPIANSKSTAAPPKRKVQAKNGIAKGQGGYKKGVKA